MCNQTARASSAYKIMNRALDPSPRGSVFEGEIADSAAEADERKIKGTGKGKGKGKGKRMGKSRGGREPSADEPFPPSFAGCGCGDVLVVRGFHPKMTLRIVLDSIADALDLDAMAEAAMEADDGDGEEGGEDDELDTASSSSSSSSFSSSSSSSRRGGNRLLRRCREIARSFSGKAPPLGTPGFAGSGRFFVPCRCCVVFISYRLTHLFTIKSSLHRHEQQRRRWRWRWRRGQRHRCTQALSPHPQHRWAR